MDTDLLVILMRRKEVRHAEDPSCVCARVSTTDGGAGTSWTHAARTGEEFEPSEPTIRGWVAQADRDEGRRADGLTTQERKELARLRRENKQLRIEREILSKAAAWFARETDTIPQKDSRS